MSNEVRDAWDKLTAGVTFSFTADGAKTLAYCFEKFFEQFEGAQVSWYPPMPDANEMAEMREQNKGLKPKKIS